MHIRERRRIRNHLNSIHAVALMNLAEATTGLALLLALPDDARGIPVELSIEYHKKSRGRVTAQCRCDQPIAAEHHEMIVTCEIHNEAGELVATGRARWNIGPKPIPKK